DATSRLGWQPSPGTPGRTVRPSSRISAKSGTTTAIASHTPAGSTGTSATVSAAVSAVVCAAVSSRSPAISQTPSPARSFSAVSQTTTEAAATPGRNNCCSASFTGATPAHGTVWVLHAWYSPRGNNTGVVGEVVVAPGVVAAPDAPAAEVAAGGALPAEPSMVPFGPAVPPNTAMPSTTAATEAAAPATAQVRRTGGPVRRPARADRRGVNGGRPSTRRGRSGGAGSSPERCRAWRRPASSGSLRVTASVIAHSSWTRHRHPGVPAPGCAGGPGRDGPVNEPSPRCNPGSGRCRPSCGPPGSAARRPPAGEGPAGPKRPRHLS